MNPATELAPQLKQLRLSGILDSLDARNRQAVNQRAKLTRQPGVSALNFDHPG